MSFKKTITHYPYTLKIECWTDYESVTMSRVELHVPGGEVYHARAGAKRNAADPWDTNVGRRLATARAFAKIAVKMRAAFNNVENDIFKLGPREPKPRHAVAFAPDRDALPTEVPRGLSVEAAILSEEEGISIFEAAEQIANMADNQAAMRINPDPPGVTLRKFTPEEQKALDNG